MSQATDEILEKFKTLTLIETAELVSQFKETFNVEVGRPRLSIAIPTGMGEVPATAQATDRKTTFDVILESILDDKRVATLKAIRSLTSLGLKEAKDFCSSLPKTVKGDISKEEAEEIKSSLERAGGSVTIR
jgi:large subunit ribosomal protein L7/L12